MIKQVNTTGKRSWRKCRIGAIGLLCIGLSAMAQVSHIKTATTPDRLEPGLQGQTMPDDLKSEMLTLPYSKGVRLIGHTDIWARGSNLLLDVIDSCAYVSSTKPLPGMGSFGENKLADGSKAGVAVIDVSDPSNPKPLRVLQDRGSMTAAETMNAISVPGRKVLVAGAYSGGKPGAAPDDAAWLDIYDASDCKSPKLTNEYKWPENAHMINLSPNGKRVYGTSIDPFTGKGGLMILDISDMAHPRFVGKFGATRPDGTTYEFAPHEVHFSPDERRIYAGVIASQGGDLNQSLTRKGPSAESLGPEAGGIYIFDNSDIVDGKPNPQLRLISEVQHGGWHSVVQAQIGGVAYLVGSGELGACPGAWPRFSNIADEKHPFLSGEFRLAMNRKENCPERTPTEKATGGVVGSAGTASTHFNDVDTTTNTHMGLFPFQWAGLRIVDLHNPENPTEVAYFKPGDACMSHVHYMPESGQIWFACTYSGFYIIDLKPEVRSALGFPPESVGRRKRATK